MIQVYYGPGKGKTTAAAGLALRMLHQDRKVLWVSFLKIVKSGETEELSERKNFRFLKGRYTHPIFYGKGKGPRIPVIRKDQSALLDRAGSVAGGAALLVLDESLNALTAGFLTESSLGRFLRAVPVSAEIVLTGRTCPSWLKRRADLTTKFVEEKHYYTKGVAARKGIEF